MKKDSQKKYQPCFGLFLTVISIFPALFSRKYFYPIVSDQVCFNNQYCGLKLDYAKYCADRILVLPLYADIKDYEIETIVDIVKANI